MTNINNKLLIENIYTNIIKTSRNKTFFLDFNVDDTVEGRFDIIILHSFQLFRCNQLFQHYFAAWYIYLTQFPVFLDFQKF